MQTQREKIAAQLEAARSAAETKRANGVESDAFEQGEVGRLEGELARLNEINEEARPHVEAMDRRQREAREAEERARTQRRNLQERKFREALDEHYRDRLEFYRQTRPGLPKADFDRDIWPGLRAAYVAGEPDAVDQERLLGSDPVF